MHSALEYAKRIAYSSEKVLMFSYEMAVKYKDSPGVYVECGVAAGAQVIAMAAGAPNKTIYAFDSFEGIPLPSNKDDQMPGIKFLSKEEQNGLPNPGEQLLVSSGATSVSENDFWTHISKGLNTEIECLEMTYCKIYSAKGFKIQTIKGWFEDKLPIIDWPDISLLRLDGDLYNSTYVCLKYLYPKLIHGGVCIVDDYALPGCKQAVFDYFFDYRDELNAFDMKFIKDENSSVAFWTK